MPTNPNTAAQAVARARLSNMSAGWRGLTEAQRANWNGFAASFTITNALGSSIYLTGHQAYVKVNTVLLLIGSAAVSVPPALPAFGACSATGLTGLVATPIIKVAGVTPTGGATHMVYASAQRSAGVTYENDLRYIKNVSTYTAGYADITTEYVAKFGALIVGKKVFVQVVQVIAGMQDNGTMFSWIEA